MCGRQPRPDQGHHSESRGLLRERPQRAVSCRGDSRTAFEVAERRPAVSVSTPTILETDCFAQSASRFTTSVLRCCWFGCEGVNAQRYGLGKDQRVSAAPSFI